MASKIILFIFGAAVIVALFSMCSGEPEPNPKPIFWNRRGRPGFRPGYRPGYPGGRPIGRPIGRPGYHGVMHHGGFRPIPHGGGRPAAGVHGPFRPGPRPMGMFHP